MILTPTIGLPTRYVCSGAAKHGENEQQESVWVQTDAGDGDDGAGQDAGGGKISLQRNGAGTFRFAHFGLAVEFHTHFSSPIRRYADVLVSDC